MTCNFVYDLSILAALSRSLTSVVPVDDPSQLRMQTLFNVGITDIPTLSSLKSPWIACTTDDVLCSKPQLFDLLVLLPTAATTVQRGGNKTYPKLILSTPELAKVFPSQGLRATQRDARRFQTLRKGLKDFPSTSRSPEARSPTLANIESANADGNEDAETVSTVSSVGTIPDKREAVEPVTWSLMAYTSLVWWASAGDKRTGLTEAEENETDQDDALLREDPEEVGQTKEVALVAYFHRLSGLIFTTLAQCVRRATVSASAVEEQYHDEEDAEDDGEEERRSAAPAVNGHRGRVGAARGEDEDEDQALLSQSSENDEVEVVEEDVRAMGLDVWSDSDRRFIEEMIDIWWGRKAVVRGGTVECCGIRVL